ncbi:unnamed protein product [Bemisia tabaci]|uniref:Protein lin-52 homolog n=1 Tax=Bemisia tabaci TaxID=7038 RepID=A0A9P0A3H3_BEMTA|nr:PREDICTED: protein lin-52 homolog [Bemisia tabaci]CAH0385562.1 unnamed protein product [Bemisia tabaci]
MSDVDELLSLEKLDRTSPELWPEQIPGVTAFARENTIPQNVQKNWNQPFTQEEQSLLCYYSSLSKDAMDAELKKLHEIAYNLGIEEAKEMTRGKYLKILNSDGSS